MKTDFRENTGMAPRGLCNMLKEYRETASVEKGPEIVRIGNTAKIEQDKLDIVQVKLMFFCQPIYYKPAECFMPFIKKVHAQKLKLLDLAPEQISTKTSSYIYGMDLIDTQNWVNDMYNIVCPPWLAVWNERIGVAGLPYESINFDKETVNFNAWTAIQLRQYAKERYIAIPKAYEAKANWWNIFVIKKEIVPEAPATLLESRIQSVDDARGRFNGIKFEPYDQNVVQKVHITAKEVKTYFGVHAYTQGATEQQAQRGVTLTYAFKDCVDEYKKMKLMCVRGAVSRSMRSGTMEVLCILLIGKNPGTGDLVV
ncbi:hypothetical protein SARC_11728 [Sphaeroforma arctica JP610]|uniref:Uncharacterized protein n=1 Tax=Sphaeroforma arctica JP610 TaxID=667725 RepID=A0A0L0FG54_9EUKA|nr:hypothetical protein SARC_11728 [Sphaeroforma arctica JP610]KNC75754.1 hypothetical protein SARC_11728 [Sphaeroforma arctica JP610]|eukprot:XP_014149656.1 hypothetical protein SARC_11728 [Sphaeroforma arctica JP610]